MTRLAERIVESIGLRVGLYLMATCLQTVLMVAANEWQVYDEHWESTLKYLFVLNTVLVVIAIFTPAAHDIYAILVPGLFLVESLSLGFRGVWYLEWSLFPCLGLLVSVFGTVVFGIVTTKVFFAFHPKTPHLITTAK